MGSRLCLRPDDALMPDDAQAAALAAAGATAPADVTDIEEIAQRHDAAVMAGHTSCASWSFDSSGTTMSSRA